VGRPSAAASAETRGRILQAARRTFAAAGYAGASNKQIAEAAGVTASALYHWFDSKAALFHAALEESVDILLEAYVDAAMDERTCVDRLCAALEANVVLNREHPGLAEFLAGSPMELRRSPELVTSPGSTQDPVSGLFRTWLEEGMREGEIDGSLDVEGTVRLLTAVSFGLSWFHGLVPKPEDHDEMLRLCQRLLRGQLLSTRAAAGAARSGRQPTAGPWD